MSLSELQEGQPVCYVGDGRDGLDPRARGRLLAFAGSTAGHVQWSAGPRRGQVTLMLLDDLAPTTPLSRHVARASHDGLEDSLEVGPLRATGLRGTFAEHGEAGVLTHLALTGALGGFATIAQEVLAHTTSRVRAHHAIRSAVAELDDEDGEALVQLAARTLLRDAFGTDDG